MRIEILDEAEQDLIDGFASTKIKIAGLAITSSIPFPLT